jgi:hypothetical protein
MITEIDQTNKTFIAMIIAGLKIAKFEEIF